MAKSSAIMSVIVINGTFANVLTSTLTGYTTPPAVTLVKGIILRLTFVAEGWLNKKITTLFSRITAIIFAVFSMQYIIHGLTNIRLLTL